MKTGSWKGSKKAAVNGAVNGFVVGTMTGAIAGTINRSVKVVNAAKNWQSGKDYSGFDSMKKHYNKHGINEGFSNGNNIVNYTNDAIDFMNRNSDSLQFTYNYNYNNTSWNLKYSPGMGGEFTNDGHIITFWYIRKR